MKVTQTENIEFFKAMQTMYNYKMIRPEVSRPRHFSGDHMGKFVYWLGRGLQGPTLGILRWEFEKKKCHRRSWPSTPIPKIRA